MGLQGLVLSCLQHYAYAYFVLCILEPTIIASFCCAWLPQVILLWHLQLCNLCSNVSTYDWLLYISEWSEEGGQSCNNARATVRAAVHGLLCDRPAGQERAAALMFNLALKEVTCDSFNT